MLPPAAPGLRVSLALGSRMTELLLTLYFIGACGFIPAVLFLILATCYRRRPSLSLFVRLSFLSLFFQLLALCVLAFGFGAENNDGTESGGWRILVYVPTSFLIWSIWSMLLFKCRPLTSSTPEQNHN